MILYKISVPVVGILSRSLQAVIIDLYETKGWAIAGGPLKIIDQRPDEVAANVDAAASGFEHCVDITVKKFNTPGVVHLAIVRKRVVKVGAVFGDINWRALILIVD